MANATDELSKLNRFLLCCKGDGTNLAYWT